MRRVPVYIEKRAKGVPAFRQVMDMAVRSADPPSDRIARGGTQVTPGGCPDHPGRAAPPSGFRSRCATIQHRSAHDQGTRQGWLPPHTFLPPSGNVPYWVQAGGKLSTFPACVRTVGGGTLPTGWGGRAVRKAASAAERFPWLHVAKKPAPSASSTPPASCNGIRWTRSAHSRWTSCSPTSACS